MLAREAGTAMQPAAQARGLDLAIEVEETVGAITGDARRLRQAIDHLLRNAIAYTPPEGRVLFHADGDARRAAGGVGQWRGDRSGRTRAIFDRFQRAAERTEGEVSRRLGLPLTRQFVEALAAGSS